MPEAADHIEEILTKVAKLIRVFDETKQQLFAEQKKTGSLQKLVEDLQHELNQSKQRELLYKAALNELSANDKKELEKKLNGYIKTIDRVVVQLGHSSDE